MTNHLPKFLLNAIPAFATLRDLRHTGFHRFTWLERAGSALAVLLYLVSETAFHARDYYLSSGQPSWRDLLFRELTLAAVGLGLVIARRIGPAWR